ncbi:MAG: Uma2 family endonuclease [Pirellulaceae bacterium]
MSTTTPMTAEQLLGLPRDGRRYELVAGELKTMTPAGWKHGMIVGDLHVILGEFVREKKLGRIFGAETGFLIQRDPDTVRAPDVAFLHRDHLPQQDPPEAYWPGAPDLAVEVLSPGDTIGEVTEKTEAWLAAGAAQVWLVNPGDGTVTVHRAPGDVEILCQDDTLEGGDVVPGFRCRVGEIFAK